MIALDILLLLMIIVCIVYCWILNRRIQDLHNSRVEFARMIKEFDAAIVKADKAITEMQNLSSINNEQIIQAQDVLKNATNMYHELSMITDVGKNISERLEKNITIARKFERMLDKMNERISDNDAKAHHHSSHDNIFEDEEILDSEVEQRTLSPDEALALHHKNELQYALQRIVKGGEGPLESNHLNQSGYFNTLKKVSTRK